MSASSKRTSGAEPVTHAGGRMSRELLTAYELVGGYGTIDILHGVSLNVGAGEIVTVIGPNGAGKSTAFKTIVGFLRPKSGRVVFNGEEITGMRPDLGVP